ncbi:MAG: SDR family oxidoreductase [Chitinophagaceae bacterium]|nr:SDR family oxidoreductase [Chitinophagaceae bacterium]
MNIVITGASKGIGKAIAEKFVAEGCNVFICARTESELIETVQDLSAINNIVKIFYSVVDLSVRTQVSDFAGDIIREFGRVDVLINNAGVFLGGSLANEEEGLLEKMMETNLYSAYHLSRALLPGMIQHKSGHIFNICSVASHQAYPNGGSYSISKFALLGFSKNLREELKPLGIKVTSVSPGATMSDSWSGSMVSEDRIMEASDIAEMIWSISQLSPQAVVEDIIMRPLLGDL